MRSLLSLTLLALVAAGCATTGASGGSASSIVGPTWQLVALGADAPVGTEAQITFGADGRVNGSTGCNGFFGGYTLGPDGALTLSQVGSTRRACPGPQMAQESRVLDALNRADRVVMEGDRLSLVQGQTRLLTFASTGSASANATMSGTVAYRERIALPPDAVLTVKLLDVSRADAASVTLGETRTSTDGRQVPLPFTIRYDAAQVQPRNRYVVRAEITGAAGALMWTTDTAVPVLTNGAPSTNISLMLRQVEPSQTSALDGRTWRLAEIHQASGVVLSYDAQAPFTLTFGADGRYNGQADCNQYGGAFESGADGTLSLSAGLSTLAACPDPSASGAFFGILSSAERYTIAGGRLTIRAQDGGALVFE